MEQIEDLVAIEQLYREFNVAAGMRDAVRLAATFSEDGVWTNISAIAGFDDVETRGQTALRKVLGTALDGVVFTHMMAEPRVYGFEGDRVKVDCVFRELAQPIGKSVVLFFGRYDDELVRTGAGWRIARRTTHPVGFYEPKAEFTFLMG